ncbi:Oidioi.mRNA.OKI2018_I69.chr2.g4239.t1.cds [Oikopleura dioica]|uniref:Oidioi.mRNA.OKI2018_I69.chr2.g4239.t1.cds n=1 Tax=Oikopleura dioica TaxID=34765 RepID=A0ABN7T353_OIKDI|nr:Oidioi.mRNA.OKI2018_I69.chr2.g4239.t1.cds [Oikopleura dioica]
MTTNETQQTYLSNFVKALAVKKCWVSTSPHADELFPRAVKIIENACPVGVSSNVYASGQGQITRISFDSETPELEYLQYSRDPFYVHCDITVCFINEECPGFCEHSREHPVWKSFVKDNHYQQLSIHNRWGPFYKSDSPALDFANLEPQEKEPDEEEQLSAINQYLEMLSMQENKEEPPPEEEKFVAPGGSGPLVLIFSLVFSFVATMALISTVSFFCSRRGSYDVLNHSRAFTT